jgi:C4-dicarboxylate-specific signal transduction histidine kinase
MIRVMPMGFEADAQRLRAALRDLVALSAVPAAWVGREPPAIAAGLADVLVNSLRLDFAFVRLRDPNTEATVEIARGSTGPAIPEWLQHYLAMGGRLSRSEIVRNIGDGAQGGRGIVIPVGVNAEGGLVAAACDRAGFPGEIDQLLLSVAANHAATAYRMARLVDDHRRAEAALRESERQLYKARDHLEAKVAERTAELQRSEAYLAEAQRLSHIGSFGWDICSGKLYWSEEMFRIFECDRSHEPTVNLVLQRTHPQDRAVVHQTMLHARQDRKALDFEHRLLLPDGQIRRVHIVGHPAFDETGGFVEFVGTVLDVTERRQAEQERQAIAHAHRITTMGHLTASIAHEINQPIAAVVTNAEAALRWVDMNPPDLQEVQAALARIVRAGRRAGEVLGGIRALIAKAPRKDMLDVNSMILEVIALTRSEMYSNGIALRTQLAPDLPLVQGDRVQLQQVMLNLILNAVEALSEISEGSRDLLISSEGGADRVRVAVQDSGPGLRPRGVDRVFEAFYTTKPEGMGMGLTICRSIIEAHGGRLWATANELRGAEFQFTLPPQQHEAPLTERAGQSWPCEFAGSKTQQTPLRR